MSDEQLYTVAQVANLLQYGEETIRRMLRDGRLRGIRLGATKSGWRIPASELARVLGRGA